MILIGEKLKQLRQENGLRQEQVARLVGADRSSISAWENDTRQPSYQALVRLAEVYNVSTDFLLGRTGGRPLDLSGLTTAEATMISELVASMTAKNKKWEEFAR